MDAIVKFLEKHQALFDKISRNIYLVAIKDGFLSNMPIVLFSSLFLLLSTLPAYVGIALPSECWISLIKSMHIPWDFLALWWPAPRRAHLPSR